MSAALILALLALAPRPPAQPASRPAGTAPTTAAGAPSPSPVPARASGGAHPPADTRTLRDADRELAEAVAAHDRSAFAARLEEGAFFSGGQRVLEGRPAVTAGWAPFFDEDGPRLEWTPELAELARSGDVGYTIGRSRYRERPGVQPQDGRYVTVWRRGEDGVFRVAIDLTLRPPDASRTEPLTRSPRRAVTSRARDLEATAGTFTVEGGAGTGAYLVIRRRGPDGTLATALESLVFFPPGDAQ